MAAGSNKEPLEASRNWEDCKQEKETESKISEHITTAERRGTLTQEAILWAQLNCGNAELVSEPTLDHMGFQ